MRADFDDGRHCFTALLQGRSVEIYLPHASPGAPMGRVERDTSGRSRVIACADEAEGERCLLEVVWLEEPEGEGPQILRVGLPPVQGWPSWGRAHLIGPAVSRSSWRRGTSATCYGPPRRTSILRRAC